MTSKHSAFVSCVMYTATFLDDGLLEFLNRLGPYLKRNFHAYEIILVNDSGASLTGLTSDVLDAETKSNVILLDLAYRHGLERAMLAGTDLAVGDFVFEIDYPDPALPPECLGTVFEYAQEHGVDIVGGTSRVFQPLMSQIFYRVMDRLRVVLSPLATEVVRIVSRRALNKTLADRRNTRYRKYLYILSGFRYEQVDLGDVRISLPHIKSYRTSLALDMIAASSRFGSSAATFLALSFLVISLLLGIYALFVWLLGYPVADGWTTIMGLLSIGFTGTFAAISLIARMLAIVLDEVQNAEPYRVREVVRLGNK